MSVRSARLGYVRVCRAEWEDRSGKLGDAFRIEVPDKAHDVLLKRAKVAYDRMFTKKARGCIWSIGCAW